MTEAQRLAIDLGQSGTRLVIVRAGGDRSHLAGPGHRAGRPFPDSVAAAVAGALGAAGIGRLRVAEVGLGLTGLHGTAPDAATIATLLRDRVTFDRLVAADDSVTAYLGALGRRPGVVVIAGTGAVALAADGHGQWAHVDGWGCYLGDDGGGYWVGRRGLAAAYRAADGRGGATALLAALHRRGVDPRGLPPRLAADPDRVATIAGFAVDVAVAAADGDAVATAILIEAGDELATSADTAATRAGIAGPVDAAVVGRLAEAVPVLADSFRRNLDHRRPGSAAVILGGNELALGAERLLDPGAGAYFPDLVAVEGAAPRPRRRRVLP